MPSDVSMDELYVIVTVAPNGIIHAWGEGPVVGGQVDVFDNRADARRVADQFRREDQQDRKPGEDPLIVKVCKVLGTRPVTVKAQRSA